MTCNSRARGLRIPRGEKQSLQKRAHRLEPGSGQGKSAKPMFPHDNFSHPRLRMVLVWPGCRPSNHHIYQYMLQNVYECGWRAHPGPDSLCPTLRPGSTMKPGTGFPNINVGAPFVFVMVPAPPARGWIEDRLCHVFFCYFSLSGRRSSGH